MAPPSTPAGAPPRPDDGRAFERIDIEVEVNLRNENTFFTGFSENISEGGLFVATEAPWDIGESIEISLRIMGAEATPLVGVVRWVRSGGTSGGLPAGMGVQFVDMDEAVRRALQSFVDSGAKDTLFFDLD